MKYLLPLRKPKYLVLLVHPLFRPRWVDAIDRGLMRPLRGIGTNKPQGYHERWSQQRSWGNGPGLRKVAAGKWARGCLLANNFNNEIKHMI